MNTFDKSLNPIGKRKLER